MAFQAALIPCICLRNDPMSDQGNSWREQILSTLNFIEAIIDMNPTARRCHTVIEALCGQFLSNDVSYTQQQFTSTLGADAQSNISGLHSMAWPSLPTMGADVDYTMQDDAWMEFLRAESGISGEDDFV